MPFPRLHQKNTRDVALHELRLGQLQSSCRATSPRFFFVVGGDPERVEAMFVTTDVEKCFRTGKQNTLVRFEMNGLQRTYESKVQNSFLTF